MNSTSTGRGPDRDEPGAHAGAERPPTGAGPLRWVAAVAAAALPLLAMTGTALAWQERLPDPMPTHWGVDGRADGVTPLAAVLTTLGVVAAVGVLVAGVAAGTRRWSWHARRAVAAAGAVGAGFATGTWLMSALAALDAADAYRVPAPTWHLALLLTAAILPAAGVFAALGPAPAGSPAAGRPAADLPRVDLSTGQRAAWYEVTVPHGMVVVLAVSLLATALVGALARSVWAAAPTVAVVLIVGLAFTVLRLTVDRRGLRIRFGPWGWPQVTVNLDEIEYAEVTEVRPSEWGGWGYRMRPRGRALVLRRGPGVRLALSGGRQFVATTRDPHTVAGLLNTLVERVRSPEPT
ncbi:MAG: DUF1648 domain-containing protein [Micromonosporaceae bacterium]